MAIQQVTQEALRDANVKQDAIARALNVSQSAVSRMVSGPTKPRADFLTTVERLCALEPGELMRRAAGRADTLTKAGPQPEKDSVIMVDGVRTDDPHAILNQLSAEDQQVLIDLAKRLIAKDDSH